MARPTSDIEALHRSHARLHSAVERLAHRSESEPTRLPGWTVGHLLTHIARNADSVVRRLDAAARGEYVEQYVGGAAGRAAEIDRGAGRPFEEIVADLVAADDHLDQVLHDTADQTWDALVEFLGKPAPASELPFARLREVEIHHVDLGSGYRPADWPADMVERMLPRALEALPDRANGADLLAWTLGRGDAPDLPPWG